jgi:hypothetical protein
VTAKTDMNKITFNWDYPLTPTDFTLTKFYTDSVLPSVFDGGSPITHYSIYYYDMTQGSFSRLDRQSSVPSFLASAVGVKSETSVVLTKGSSYKIALTSSNSLGESKTETKTTILQAQYPSVLTNGETS